MYSQGPGSYSKGSETMENFANDVGNSFLTVDLLKSMKREWNQTSGGAEERTAISSQVKTRHFLAYLQRAK